MNWSSNVPRFRLHGLQAIALGAIVVALLIGIGLAGAPGLGAAVETGASEPPIEVTAEYVGENVDADHAFAVAVTLEPDERTLKTSSIDVAATEEAFLSAGSIDTSVSTRDGRQVVSRVEDSTAAFDIGRLHPGEQVTIEVMIYPRMLVPDDDRLATVEASTQFSDNQEIVSDSIPVNPEMRPTDVGIVESEATDWRLLLGSGVGVGLIVAGGATWLVWRRRRAHLQRLARQLRDVAVAGETRRLANELLGALGGTDGAATDPIKNDTSDADNTGQSDSDMAQIELTLDED